MKRQLRGRGGGTAIGRTLSATLLQTKVGGARVERSHVKENSVARLEVRVARLNLGEHLVAPPVVTAERRAKSPLPPQRKSVRGRGRERAGRGVHQHHACPTLQFTPLCSRTATSLPSPVLKSPPAGPSPISPSAHQPISPSAHHPIIPSSAYSGRRALPIDEGLAVTRVLVRAREKDRRPHVVAQILRQGQD